MTEPAHAGPHRRSTWIAVGLAVAVVAAVSAVAANLWSEAGDSQISGSGWVALGLGVSITLALGIGLMALVFISSRRGYDERDELGGGGR